MPQPQSPSLQQVQPSRWVARAEPNPEVAETLARELALPAALCRLLALRGFTQTDRAKRYLKPRLDELHDPFLLAGMDAAVKRLQRAITDGEKILVHGDYDVDGICSATLFTRVLRSLGATVEAFVPHRLKDGYDLSQAGVRAAAEFGATLILTGDCGIVAHEAIQAARDLGIDVIVTDHHTPGEQLPDCAAVINPNRSDCHYPDKGLAGVGVAFKLCQALAKVYGKPDDALWYYLDLVAVATIADLAPLTGENRALTRFGLKVLRESKNPGLTALLQTAGLNEFPVLAAGQVSHVLAPRINAVGRMSAAATGVKLLLEEDPVNALAIAQTLEDENRTRQEVDRATLQQALDMLEGDYDPERNRVIVLAAEGWHPGVIGIVASRVVELLHRPTILIALEEGGARGRGSARSIPGFHLYNALHSCAHHLDRFGGHKYAAGMDIRAENIPLLRADLEAYAAEVLTPDDLVPELCYDLEVTIGEANADLLRLMRHLGPHGVGNPSPVFVARNVTVAGYPKIVGDNHLKLNLSQDGAMLPAIGFRMANCLNDVDVARCNIDVAFQLQVDRFNGREYIQAKLLDLRASA
jgi:single-stranded-DNA-specific exonuclease